MFSQLRSVGSSLPHVVWVDWDGRGLPLDRYLARGLPLMSAHDEVS